MNYEIFFTGFAMILMGCSKGQTPENYLNRTTVDRTTFISDSVRLTNELYEWSKKEDGPFQTINKSHIKRIVIDTILYSPDYDRFAFFVITKLENHNPPQAEVEGEFIYEGYCFLGSKKENFKIVWLAIFNLSNFPSQESVVEGLRYYFFNEHGTTTGDKSTKLLYNLDDVRFWDGPTWDLYF